MADYIPTNLPTFTDWVGLQRRQRAAYATTLGLTPADVQTRDEADAKMLDYCTHADDALAAASRAVAAREAYKKQYEASVRADINRYKTHPSYTEALGKENDWLSSSSGQREPDTLQATVKVAFSAEGIRLDWAKLGQDGVEVFRRPAGTPTWTKLAFDSRSPYIDTEQGLTGPFEYYTQLMHDDKPVGMPSDIVTALHGGR
jgi:hypothetical protein